MKYHAKNPKSETKPIAEMANVNVPWKNPRGARLLQCGQVLADVLTGFPQSLHGFVPISEPITL